MNNSLSPQSRRRFLGAAALGAAAFTTRGLFAEELARVRTPAQTEGPFYPNKLPLDTDNDLLIVNDAITPAVGEITHLSGRILDAKGNPVRNALVEIWQVDGKGVYLHTGDSDRKERDKNFQGFGRFLTGSSGEYYFRTVKPVPYPGRTPHIHFKIKKSEKELLTTQCYIKGEQRNERDGIFRSIRDAKARDAVLVAFAPLKGSRIAELEAKFDIVLGWTPESKQAEIRMRVLVVEDEPDLRRVVARALREAGYAVDEAADGEEGLYKATNWQYDALVLDLMLPRLDGWELLRRMRRTHKTPVLILTARDAVGDRVRGLDSGADDYLVKPFELIELQARLRALIRRAAGNAVAAIEIGDVVVDTAARVVTCAGQSVALTAREYALVELLAQHRGHLITRSMIYEHLFDETEDSLSNLVDVHVSNVRKKLGKDFITTRRGQGYLIDV